MTIEAITDHADAGIARYISDFQERTDLVEFTRIVLDQLQEIEDAGGDVCSERSLDTAVGVQLDLLGTILNEPRDGRTDPEYREALRIKIVRNRASGEVEPIIAIVQSATGASSVTVQDIKPGVFRVDHDGAVVLNLAEVVAKVKAAGVRVDVVTTTGFPFIYASVTPGNDNPEGVDAGGYDTVVPAEAGVGGEYSTVILV